MRVAIARRVLSWSGPVARLYRNPNPFYIPYRRHSLDLIRDRGLGDVLMCTPVLREIKRLNPNCFIRFYTDYPSLLDGLPYVDEVHPADAAPQGAINLGYEDAMPSKVHLARIIGDRLGVTVRDVRPDCIISSKLVESFKRDWTAGTLHNIVILRRASRWTPNKDWPSRFWDDLIRRLGRQCRIIEIGETAPYDIPAGARDYVDLRGDIGLHRVIAAIAASDLYVGPVSGPLHIAAAAQIPAVIIGGGYESATNTAYPGTVPMFTDIPCSPCWLRTPCPIGVRCLTLIAPSQVEQAVKKVLGNKP